MLGYVESVFPSQACFLQYKHGTKAVFFFLIFVY